MNADSRTPVATLLIIAANIGAAFLTILQPELVDRFGFTPAAPQVLPALACLFMHANLVHLLGNMVFLAAAGPAAETAVGSLKFFGVYLAGGLAGVAAHWALDPNKSTPLIGASGAVAACVALAAVRFYRTKVPVLPSVSVPVLAIVVVWLMLQVIGGFVRLAEEAGGASYWAHVGGAAAGLLLALAYKAPREADRRASEAVLVEMRERGPAAVLAAADKHLRLHPDDAGALLQKADAHAKLGDGQSAAAAYLQALERAPQTRQAEIVEQAASSGCLQAMPSAKRTMLAAKLRSKNEGLAATLLESVVTGPAEDEQRPDAILALADLAQASDPERAKSLACELIRCYPLHPAAEIAKARGWSS